MSWYHLFLLLLATVASESPVFQESIIFHTVVPGDTWTAVALQYDVDRTALQAANAVLNKQQQPAIGSQIVVPANRAPRKGRLQRPAEGSLINLAVSHGHSLWRLALENRRHSPYLPQPLQPIITSDGNTPLLDLPTGFLNLTLSQNVAQPGQALGVRALTAPQVRASASLGGEAMHAVNRDGRFLALTGTGAFYGTRQPLLSIQNDGGPVWEQPWQFIDPDTWTYQQLTLTGAAAAIDQESIRLERERLFELWQQTSPEAQWQSPFRAPVDNYLEITSTYGARRSYNGGPYQTYHEGVDFAAYGGTPVLTPAAGTVRLAEPLYVRGGAVIIDHGLGIYSGYYHMSNIFVTVGERVEAGQPLGEVGTTGLSTGNHLHWDLLVNGVWVDAEAWLTQGMDCWILEALGDRCLAPTGG